MTEKTNEIRCGVTPVMSQAGVVPGPMPRMGPPSATSGHPRSRYVNVRQRRRFKERKKKQKPKSDKPKDHPKQQSCLNILQVNISGISNKKIEIARLLSEKNIHVALVQESLHQNTDPHISNYTPTTCDHIRENCQGIISYIRNDITGVVEKIESDRPTDLHKITIWHSGCKYTIYNVYNPPWNNITFDSIPEVNFEKTVVAGDFNGHSPEWGYTDHNNSGKAVEELCERTNLCLLQDENSEPTLLFKVNKKTYRPDLTMISSDLLNRYTVDVLDSVGSDHRPILTSLYGKTKKNYKQRTKWNFKKANWQLYKEKTDQLLQSILNQSCPFRFERGIGEN